MTTATSTCPDTINGEHDWLPFTRPARVHFGDTETVHTDAHEGAVCRWCGVVR